MGWDSTKGWHLRISCECRIPGQRPAQLHPSWQVGGGSVLAFPACRPQNVPGGLLAGWAQTRRGAELAGVGREMGVREMAPDSRRV